MQPYPPIVAKAIKALNIRNPIYRYEVTGPPKGGSKGKTVTFWLYAHTEPVSWTDRSRKRKTRTTA